MPLHVFIVFTASYVEDFRKKAGPRAYFLCPLFLAASGAAALIQLVLVCTSYEGRSRGLLEIRLRVLPAGRMGGIVRCGCNLSLAARMAY